jgi:DNA-binding transcriptional MerR regulator
MSKSDANRASKSASTGASDSGPTSAPASEPPHEYRTQEVVQILDLSRRQLQYWAQTDLVVPSAKTRGGHNRYTFEDLVALKATKRLIDAGVSVQRIRSSIQALRKLLPEIERPLSELVLVATGDVVLVFREDSAFEAVSGQEWVFEVAQFQREVETWRNLRRARPVRRTRAGGVSRSA